MLTRLIPSTGEAVPVIGLGTWQTFDVGTDATSRAPLREVLRLFLAAGGRLIDSSPMYGRAEGVAGDLVAELNAREKTFLATKVWTTGRAQGEAQMRRSADLMRAGVLDLIQIHNLVDWKTHLATLRRMKEEGSVRYIGITHYTTASLDTLADIVSSENIDFVQFCYSIGTRQAERRLLPLCAERGVATIINRPLEEGALFRRARGRSLPPVAVEVGCASWAQFFLKFIVAHRAVTCVIPATAKPEHMADNLAAGSALLPDEKQHRAMAQAFDAI
jgi:diketogulonate reductase-like aldo/keto reductase